VPESGGGAEVVSQLDGSADVRTHRWPRALPGGQGVLVTVARTTDQTFDQARIAVITPNGQTRDLVDGGSFPAYASTGHLVYSRGGALLAVPFDLDNLSVSGTPTTVLDDVVTDPVTGAAHYAMSGTSCRTTAA
jgi:hypothetical protein